MWCPIARTERPPKRAQLGLRPIVWEQLSNLTFKRIEVLYDEENILVASRFEKIDGKPYRVLVAKNTSSNNFPIKPLRCSNYPEGYLTLDYEQRKVRTKSERTHYEEHNPS
tara:strand:- start:277 stop:609 length:333 start_codon:yes stop_codon:yes gene_type:complete